MHAEYPCGRISRRNALYRFGLLGSAIGAVWSKDGKAAESQAEAQKLPQKAKSVILLFMCGGVSHIDTFDPKDNKFAGKIMDAIGFGDNLAPRKRPVIPCRRTFKKYGESGIPVSDWFPNVGGVIDDIAVVRSFWSHETNHFPARDRDYHRSSGPSIRLADHGQLDLLRRWVRRMRICRFS